jgi:hypothetical protein
MIYKAARRRRQAGEVPPPATRQAVMKLKAVSGVGFASIPQTEV